MMQKLSLVVVLSLLVSIVVYGATGWTDDGSVVRLTTSSDNVSIGTSSAYQKLHVNGNVYLPYNKKVIFGGASIEGYLDGYGGLKLYGNGGGYNNLGITVDPSGRIGIGTASPGSSYKLDVNGAIRMTGFTLTTGKHDGYVLTSDGNGVGTWQAPSGGGGTSWWDDDGDNIYCKNNGNVGIGTSTPNSKLSVGGNAVGNSGQYIAIYGECPGSGGNSIGVYGKGSGCYAYSIGVQGEGVDYGVYGTGNHGVYGKGGTSSVGVGVYGEGYYGVYGKSTNIGVIGEGDIFDFYAQSSNGKSYFAGKVGIGTSSPSQKLHVNGNVYLPYNQKVIFGGASIEGYLNSYGGLKLYGNGGGDNNLGITVDPSGRIGIMKSSASYPLDVNGIVAMTGFKLTTGADSGYVLTSNGNGVGTWQAVSGGGGSCLWEGNTSTTYYNGKVGIGTSSPSDKLEVRGEGLRVTGPGGSYIRLDNSNNPGDWLMNFSSGNLNFQYSSNDGASWDNKLKITYNGDVGIGTPNPQSKLAVNGTITAKEIEVQLEGWSDFVFEENYELMPLSKLENHIKKEKNLPGIPKEKEIAENGVKLGEMQAKLLEKVEELTLYVIEQNKELTELKKENGELKQRISMLEK